MFLFFVCLRKSIGDVPCVDIRKKEKRVELESFLITGGTLIRSRGKKEYPERIMLPWRQALFCSMTSPHQTSGSRSSLVSFKFHITTSV
jgi:hypothetical protein